MVRMFLPSPQRTATRSDNDYGFQSGLVNIDASDWQQQRSQQEMAMPLPPPPPPPPPVPPPLHEDDAFEGYDGYDGGMELNSALLVPPNLEEPHLDGQGGVVVTVYVPFA